MIKKILRYSIIALLFFVTCAFCIINAKASDQYAPFTIIANPGEDASSEIRISFQTYQDISEVDVEYTKVSDENWFQSKTIKAQGVVNTVFDGNSSKDASGTNITENGKLYDYNVNLVNLDSNTEYKYKVIGTLESDVHYFKTAGSNEYSFAWIGDFHSYTPIPNRLKVSTAMVNTIIQKDPSVDFVLSTGDDVAWGGSYSFWKRMYEEDYIKNYMHVACIGNHDHMDRTSEKNSNEYFKTVNNNPLNGYEGEEGVSFWMVYSNTLYFFLNNETLGTKSTPVCIDWMREVVKAHPTQYIFIVSHYQAFNAITGATASNYNRFCEFCDEVGVDVVFTGNQHIYLRTKSLYGGKVSTDDGLGTVYVQCPSSDNERGQDMNETLTYNQDLIASRFTEGGRTIGGSLVKVTEEGIALTLYNRNGEVIDQTFIKAKRNNFDMSGFNKDEFLNDFEFRKSSLTDSSLFIKLPESAMEYVKSVKIYEKDVEVASIEPKSKRNLAKYINNIMIDETHTYDVVIQYQDNSKDKFTYDVDFYDYEFKYLDVVYDKEEEMIVVKYDIDCPKVSKYKVYFDDELYMQTSDKELLFSATKYNLKQVVKVEAVSKDRRVLATIIGRPYKYGDANLDGTVDGLDLTNLIDHLTGKSEYFNDVFADVDNDGKIDLRDVTILKLMNEDKIDLSYKEKATVKVKFEEEEKTIDVNLGEKVDIEDFEYENLVAFDTPSYYIYKDTELVPLYEVAPTSITINGTTQVVTNKEYLYTVFASPLYACDDVVFTIDCEYGVVNANGTITFTKAGETTIMATSKVNGVFYQLKVTITGGN